MTVMVCTQCGLADESPKPIRCAKCGGRDFYASTPSPFAPGKKAVTPAETAAPPAQSQRPSESATGMTLFDKYGGVPTISKIVKAFHREIMQRTHLAAYFDGIDLEHLAEHTVKYIAFVMGKPAEIYTGRDMYNAHAKYHISGIHFDEVADVLKDILQHADMEKSDIDIIMRRIESLRDMIAV